MCDNPQYQAQVAAQVNYSHNNQGAIYNPAKQPFNPTILTPSWSYYAKAPGQCLNVMNLQPYENWAKEFGNSKVRKNIDGELIPSNLCAYSCSNTGNDMVNPVPYPVKQNYIVPGAVPFAIKVFTQCGPCGQTRR